MRAWANGQVGNVVWRKVFTDHPGLIELFSPGNESTLATARAQEPKLEDAIIRFGPPPPALIEELLNGRSSASRVIANGWGVRPNGFRANLLARAGMMPSPQAPPSAAFLEEHALSAAQLQQFFAEGYLVIPVAVPTALIEDALRHVNSSVGRGAVDRSKPMLVGLAEGAARAPELLSVFDSSRGSKLPTAVQSLLGRGRAMLPPFGCQVAMKYPSPGAAIPADGGVAAAAHGDRWHVDGFNKGAHSPFTLLVGVALSAQAAPRCGELMVHPGAHWQLQGAVRDHVASGSATFSRMDEGESEASLNPINGGRAGSKPNLAPPVSVLLQPGDAVLCHQKLPHLGANNYSPHVRHQLYFRIAHVALAEHRDQWLDDLLLPFEGVRAAVDGAP